MTLSALQILPLSLLLEAVETHPDVIGGSIERDHLVVIGHVSQIWGISTALLNGRSQVESVREARQAAMFVLLECGYTLTQAASRFARRHGAAITAQRTIKRLIASGDHPRLTERLHRLRLALDLIPQTSCAASAPVQQTR